MTPKTMMFALLFMALAVTAAMAQTGTPTPMPQLPTMSTMPDYIPDTLKTALNLTYNQLESINWAINDFQDLANRKNNRSWELDQKIWALRNDAQRDPYAIAFAVTPLLAEQIQIGRDLDTASAKAQAAIYALMNSSQRSLLAKLQEALRLQSTAWDAVNTHFLLQPPPSPATR